jgi:SAM-dependent methyltransferase
VPADRHLIQVYDLGELPFHVGARPEPSNDGLPDRLRFVLGLDERADLLVQMPDAAVEAHLENAYELGSQIGTPLAETGLGRRCLDDFLAFVLETAGAQRLDGLSILEIGSGGGSLLRELARRGADVVGVEPGATEVAGAGFEVIAEPFRADRFDRRFDAIVHYGVLEHVPDPVAFVRDQLELLDDGGFLAFSVPDCSLPIAHGDISMLVHEHWSYFTPESLEAVAALAGAQPAQGRPAGVAGAFYSAWSPGADREVRHDGASAGFAGRARANLDRMRAHVAIASASGATLGVFCPGRFINYEALLAGDLPRLRYFDDDPLLEGRFYPPSDVAIEPRAALLADPVDHVIVASWSFGRQIAASLREERALAHAEVVTISDVLG